MSREGLRPRGWVCPGEVADAWGQWVCLEGEGGAHPYHVTYPIMCVMYLPPSLACGKNDGQTPVKTLLSRNLVGMR